MENPDSHNQLQLSYSKTQLPIKAMKSLYLEGKNWLNNLIQFLGILIREILMFMCLPFILFWKVLFPVDAENYIVSACDYMQETWSVSLASFCKLNKPTPLKLLTYVKFCKLLVDENHLKVAHIVLDKGCLKMDMILFQSSFSRAK